MFYFRYLSLEESAVFLNNDQISYATGFLSSYISSQGSIATIVVRADDRVSRYSTVSQFYTDSILAWDVHDEGDIALHSEVILTGSERWNTSGLFKYGNNKYLYVAVEEISAFFCSGRGGYGGRGDR